MEELDENQSAQVMDQARDDSEPPDELDEHQSAALHQTQKVEGAEPDILDESETSHVHALATMNGTLGQGPVPMGETAGKGNTWTAAKDFYAHHDTTFRKLLYSLSLPEQFLMRNGVAAMSGMGQIDSATTKQLLTQNELYPHDILNYFWKPSSVFGSDARFLSGFASDLVLDPFNLIGVGEGKKAVEIFGKTVSGLDKMSTAQRVVFETLSKMEKVIMSDGKFMPLKDAAETQSAVESNLSLLGKARDAAQEGSPLSIQGLHEAMNLSDEGRDMAQNVVMDGLTEKSAARQLADGDRELTLGIHLPFTNLGMEMKLPGPMSQVIGKGLQAVGNPGLVGATIGGLTAGPAGAAGGLLGGAALNTMGPGAVRAMSDMATSVAGQAKSLDPETDYMKKTAFTALDNVFGIGAAYWEQAVGGSQAIYRRWQNLWTKTGDALFNDQMYQSMNMRGATKEFLAKQTNDWNEKFLRIKDLEGQNFEGLMKDFLDEAEMGIHSPEEAAQTVEAFRQKQSEPPKGGFGAEDLAEQSNEDVLRFNQLISPSEADRDRMARIAKYPELQEILGSMRNQLKAMVGKYEARNMPFDELNPFGPGWMRRYVKHTFTADFKDWLNNQDLAQNAWAKAMSESQEELGTFDASALGRKYRGSISGANEESMLKTADFDKEGVKMFVDDPVQLFNMRVQEMQEAVGKHDLLRSAMPGMITGYNPGFGWMKVAKEDFGSYDQDVQVGRKIYKTLSFVPEDLAIRLGNDQSTYVRSDVYDRLLWNTQKNTKLGEWQNILAAGNAYTWFWRNQVLANTGYLGTKFFHNMLSYFGLMGSTDPAAVSSLYKAGRAVSYEALNDLPHVVGSKAELIQAGTEPGFVNWKQLDGSNVPLSHEQLMDLAIKQGVLHTGTEVLFDDVLDHAAAAFRPSPTGKVKTLINYAYGFGAFRSLAQYGDDLPKLATFIDRLEKGFTAEAAAESATRYFYNFNPVTAEQQIAKITVPFISFPMKTAELVASQIKNGDMMQLAIPGHVQSVLDGHWVEDRDTRDYLSKVLPFMKNWYEPLHGGITPGMRSMAVELPWCYNTLSALWNEETRLHPLIQGLTWAMALKHDGTEFNEIVDGPTYDKLIGQNLNLHLPPEVTLPMTLWALNGGQFPGSKYLISRYQTKAPDDIHWMAVKSGVGTLETAPIGVLNEDLETLAQSSPAVARSALNTRFKDAVDFGKWMDKSYGQNWLYNMMFKGSLDDKDSDIYHANLTSMRGEYLRQHIHDMSLGLVQMDKLDSTMFAKYFAIDREAKDEKRKMIEEANNDYALVDPKKVTAKAALEEAAKNGSASASKVIRLQNERDAVVAYYDWMLGAKKQFPDFSLWRTLFGIDQTQMASDGKPGPQVTRDLYPRSYEVDPKRSREFWQETIDKKRYGK